MQHGQHLVVGARTAGDAVRIPEDARNTGGAPIVGASPVVGARVIVGPRESTP
jgi:hypothetical protein